MASIEQAPPTQRKDIAMCNESRPATPANDDDPLVATAAISTPAAPAAPEQATESNNGKEQPCTT